jgi:hypothetical protein
MDGMNGWVMISSLHILLTSSFYHSTLHRLNKWRTERNGGWLFRRPKHTLSCSADCLTFPLFFSLEIVWRNPEMSLETSMRETKIWIWYLPNAGTRRLSCSPSYRSQWPRGVRHELSSPRRTLGSSVRIPLEAWMSVCVYSVYSKGFWRWCITLRITGFFWLGISSGILETRGWKPFSFRNVVFSSF